MTQADKRHIIIAGGALVDRTGRLDGPSEPGCSNPGQFEESPGGTALNVASVLAALACRCDLISMIADDASGHLLLDQLRARDVPVTSHPGHPGKNSSQARDTSKGTGRRTGTYTSILEPDGSLFIALSDAALYLEFDASPYQQQIAALQAGDYFCVDANLPGPAIRHLLAHSPARNVGLTVSKAKAARLKPALAEIDLLFTNRVEAAALLGLEDVSPDQTIVDAMQQAIASSGRLAQVVISNGPEAVIIVDEHDTIILPVNAAERVIDVTGAGDALVGATLSQLVAGADLRKSVEFGIEAAHATVQFAGAYQPDLAKRIQAGHPR